TRLQGDWSSDVCSSDLVDLLDRLSKIAVTRCAGCQLLHALLHPLHARCRRPSLKEVHALALVLPDSARHALVQVAAEEVEALLEIGRASCRERGEVSVG